MFCRLAFPIVKVTLGLVFFLPGCHRGGQPNQLTPVPGEEIQIIFDRPIVKTLRPAEKAPTGQAVPVDDKAYFERIMADLGKKFDDAIAAHKQAKAGPIYALGRACKKAADDLSKHPWPTKVLRGEIESLTDQLRRAGDAIPQELKDSEKELRWHATDRIEGPARATILEADKVAWLENWQKLLLKDFAGRVENAGM